METVNIVLEEEQVQHISREYANKPVNTNLSSKELFGVEQLSVSSSPDFIHNRGLQIHEDTPRDMFTRSGLTEEGVEGVVSTSHGLI